MIDNSFYDTYEVDCDDGTCGDVIFVLAEDT